jgi:hypothetical protein
VLLSGTHSLVLTTLQAESISSLENVRITTRLKELLLITHPLRVVDTINVVLHLKNNTSILGDGSREVLVILKPLSALQREVTLLLGAAIELEGILVGINVDLDTGPGRGETGHGTLGAPVIVAELAAVDGVAVVWHVS